MTRDAVRGSCLCGSYRFEIRGEVAFLKNCHCSLCRKISGSSFATYARAKQADFVITAGADEITTYERKPGNVIAFCRRCGSHVPHPPADHVELELGAGLLDDDPEVDVAYHIFVDSRAPWVELHDDLPKFSELNAHRVVTQRAPRSRKRP